MTGKTADLHTHTNFSDGTDTPARVVELAYEAGLCALAITDHDNTDARASVQELAQRKGIELIPGIELSASLNGIEVHILGYFFDGTNPILRAHLSQQRTRRIQRVREMVARLKKLGMAIEPDEVFQLAQAGTVGRPHVARVLVQHGYVCSVSEAFSRYLADGQPAYVEGSPLAPSGIIRLVLEAGGIPVLAHPIFLKQDALIEQFVREGLVGLEVYHSSHTQEMIRRYEAMADALNLLKTGGSDYHGSSKEGLPIGASGVSYSVVEALKQWQASHSISGQ